MSLAVAALFFVLTPGVLFSLPPKGGKFMVAATHAVVFALVFHFTHTAIRDFTQRFEGFEPHCTNSGQDTTNTRKMCCNGEPPVANKNGMGDHCP
jgi:hypothetical protein